MLVDLSVTPLVEGGEEEGRRKGGTSTLVDPGVDLSLEGCFLTTAYKYFEKLPMSLLLIFLVLAESVIELWLHDLHEYCC